MPDTGENDERVGRSSSGGLDPAAFPQARIIGLVECGTPAVFDTAIGAYTTSETKLGPACFRSLSKGMLVLSDHGFWSCDLWMAAAATGADLLWRTKANVILPVLAQLEDGSYRAQIAASHDRENHRPVTVWVIEYRLKGRSKETFRLSLPSLTPKPLPRSSWPRCTPSVGRSSRCSGQWKTHQRGKSVVLRSKSPDGVVQETGHTCWCTTRSAVSCATPRMRLTGS